MRIAHVVVTDAFAGTERYVADVARETARRGHGVVVFGGAASSMPSAVGLNVQWRPARTPTQAVRQLAGAGGFDVLHVHLTHAETAAVITRPLHGSVIVATRHIAAKRGSSPAGRIIAPLIRRGLSDEIAISAFVARTVGLSSDHVLRNGVPNRAALWNPSSRTVVMAQRLEPEKDTLTGLRAWEASRLADDGWALLVAGDGQQRDELERFAIDREVGRVEFLGHVTDMDSLWRRAGILLATASAEPLGLTVLEAMAAGVPTVASQAGGHLETIGAVTDDPGFAPGDVSGAAQQLVTLSRSALLRQRLSDAERELQQRKFALGEHVDELLIRYASVEYRHG
ncbi:MAG TPA: glycosyltransferase family 4 protein [Mycobacteriales bacterium]|nr:glycosyltransferase family 4 protein [Mycobacteriales bacterium]